MSIRCAPVRQISPMRLESFACERVSVTALSIAFLPHRRVTVRVLSLGQEGRSSATAMPPSPGRHAHRCDGRVRAAGERRVGRPSVGRAPGFKRSILSPLCRE